MTDDEVMQSFMDAVVLHYYTANEVAALMDGFVIATRHPEWAAALTTIALRWEEDPPSMERLDDLVRSVPISVEV